MSYGDIWRHCVRRESSSGITYVHGLLPDHPEYQKILNFSFFSFFNWKNWNLKIWRFFENFIRIDSLFLQGVSTSDQRRNDINTNLFQENEIHKGVDPWNFLQF